MASVSVPEIGLAQRVREARGFRFTGPRMTELLGVILFNAAERAWARHLNQFLPCDMWGKEVVDRLGFEGVLVDGKLQVVLYVDARRIGVVCQDDDFSVRFHPTV